MSLTIQERLVHKSGAQFFPFFSLSFSLIDQLVFIVSINENKNKSTIYD